MPFLAFYSISNLQIRTALVGDYGKFVKVLEAKWLFNRGDPVEPGPVDKQHGYYGAV